VKKVVLVAASAVFVLALLGEFNVSRGEFGEFLKVYEFMRGRPVDAGGITFFPDDPDHFYESWRKTSRIWKRRVSDGAVVDEISIPWPSHPSTGVHGLSWGLLDRGPGEPPEEVFWISNAYYSPTIATMRLTGGRRPSGKFNVRNCGGLHYYEPEDELWVVDALRSIVYRYSPPGTLIDAFEVNFPYSSPHTIGIVRIDDRLWISNWYETGERSGRNFVSEFYLNGTPTGKTIEITNRVEHGITFGSKAAFLDLAFDGQYLWALTCNPCKVVQVDIGYGTADISPVIDSGDYTGDGTSEIAVFRPSSGLWAIRGVTRAYFGREGDIPASGDFSGDGTTDIAVFRPSSALWAVRDVTRVHYGREGDIPVPGDYTGDGTVDVAIFRPSTGLWAVRGGARTFYGREGDIPVPFYLDGRGSPKRIGIFRPSTGLWASPGMPREFFGRAGDQPLLGSFAPGAYSASPAIFRPSTALWAFLGGPRVYFGREGDQPVLGNFTGFLPDEVGIFRPDNGFWAIRGVTRAFFGIEGDIPVAGLSINPSVALVP